MGLSVPCPGGWVIWTFPRGQPLRPLRGLSTLWHCLPGRIGDQEGRSRERSLGLGKAIEVA